VGEIAGEKEERIESSHRRHGGRAQSSQRTGMVEARWDSSHGYENYIVNSDRRSPVFLHPS